MKQLTDQPVCSLHSHWAGTCIEFSPFWTLLTCGISSYYLGHSVFLGSRVSRDLAWNSNGGVFFANQGTRHPIWLWKPFMGTICPRCYHVSQGKRTTPYSEALLSHCCFSTRSTWEDKLSTSSGPALSRYRSYSCIFD